MIKVNRKLFVIGQFDGIIGIQGTLAATKECVLGVALLSFFFVNSFTIIPKGHLSRYKTSLKLSSKHPTLNAIKEILQ